MPLSVWIRSVTKTVHMYGHSDSPVRIRGVGSLSFRNQSFHNVSIFEGHVNSSTHNQRLVVLTCDLETWYIDREMEPLIGSSIVIDWVRGRNTFTLNRVSSSVDAHFDTHDGAAGCRSASEVCGLSDSEDAAQFIRGVGIVRLEQAERIDVYEPPIVGERALMLKGPTELLRRLAQEVKENGSVEITIA